MRHKYELQLAKTELTISEYGELDKEMFALLCEEKFALDAIRNALDAGLDAVIAALRSPNFYPTRYCAEKLAVAVAEICRSKDADRLEIVLDDVQVLSEEQDPADVLEEFEEAMDGTGNDLEELLADEDKLNGSKGSFRIAESEDLDEEDG
ncbi:MAG: hypothetical protein PVG78_09155 [Desulfobacterales bacterium]|jgi:hypothetical protein